MNARSAIAMVLGALLGGCGGGAGAPQDAALDRNRESSCITPTEAGIEQSVAMDVAGDARDGASPDAAPPDAAPTDAWLLDAARDGAADVGGSERCPPCMVLINGLFCIDRHEASRADATATHQGLSTAAPRCRAGVLPWYTMSLTRVDASAACALAGKRLCSTAEWRQACQGPQQTVYSYGNSYDPVVCNGIDRFCFCGAGSACQNVTPCPYAHCFNQAPTGNPSGPACGSMPHEVPTASHAACVNGWGLYDMNGNVWELADGGDGQDHFRGGAYNCIDSETLHRCDFDITGGVSARGFRCCAAPLPVATD